MTVEPVEAYGILDSLADFKPIPAGTPYPATHSGCSGTVWPVLVSSELRLIRCSRCRDVIFTDGKISRCTDLRQCEALAAQ